MLEYENKYKLIENGQFETSLKIITKNENIFIKIIKAIRKIIFGTSSNEEKSY